MLSNSGFSLRMVTPVHKHLLVKSPSTDDFLVIFRFNGGHVHPFVAPNSHATVHDFEFCNNFRSIFVAYTCIHISYISYFIYVIVSIEQLLPIGHPSSCLPAEW